MPCMSSVTIVVNSCSDKAYKLDIYGAKSYTGHSNISHVTKILLSPGSRNPFEAGVVLLLKVYAALKMSWCESQSTKGWVVPISLPPSLSLSFSLTHTYAHTHPNAQIHTPSLKHSRLYSLTPTHECTNTPTHTHTPSLTFKQSLSHSIAVLTAHLTQVRLL